MPANPDEHWLNAQSGQISTWQKSKSPVNPLPRREFQQVLRWPTPSAQRTTVFGIGVVPILHGRIARCLMLGRDLLRRPDTRMVAQQITCQRHHAKNIMPMMPVALSAKRITSNPRMFPNPSCGEESSSIHNPTLDRRETANDRRRPSAVGTILKGLQIECVATSRCSLFLPMSAG